MHIYIYISFWFLYLIYIYCLRPSQPHAFWVSCSASSAGEVAAEAWSSGQICLEAYKGLVRVSSWSRLYNGWSSGLTLSGFFLFHLLREKLGWHPMKFWRLQIRKWRLQLYNKCTALHNHIPFVSWGKPVLNPEFKIFLFLLWGLASCHNMIHPMLQRLTTPNPRARLHLGRRHGSIKEPRRSTGTPRHTFSNWSWWNAALTYTRSFIYIGLAPLQTTTGSLCRSSAWNQERQLHRTCLQWRFDQRNAFTFLTSHLLKCLGWVHELSISNLKKQKHAQRA